MSLIKPFRDTVRRDAYRERWWLHAEPIPGMRRALAGLPRYFVTPMTAKHRLFVWVSRETLTDHACIVFARDDDYAFGVLHSRIHELWARGTGTQLREYQSGFRYTPTTTFETFPFPQCDGACRETIANSAKSLDNLRRGWLNPAEALPQRLKTRTLTNLYNDRPTWLVQAHERLDRAVHAAYGWTYPLGDDELIARLLEMNNAQQPVRE